MLKRPAILLFIAGCALGAATWAQSSAPAQPGPFQLRILPQDLTLFPSNQQQLTAARFGPTASTNGLPTSVIWTPVTSSVAALDSSGLLKALAPGQMTITAASGPFHASAIVTVTQATLQGISVSPANLDFGAVALGESSAARPVTITNNSANPIALASSSTGGNFARTNHCGPSLAALANCTVDIAFTPTSAAPASSSLSIFGANNASAVEVSLSGTGVPPLTIQPATLDFSDVAAGTAGSPQFVTLFNNLSTTLTETAASSAGFSLAGACATIPAHSTCTVQITFSPSMPGPVVGALSVANNGAGSPETIPLSGNGIGGQASALSLLPSSLNFSNQLTGATSSSQSLVVSNSGAAAVTINTVSVAAPFSKTDSCSGLVLKPGKQCNIMVSFTPSYAGKSFGAVSIVSTDPASPLSASLTGSGVAGVSFSPQDIIFSGQPVKSTSAVKSVTLVNAQNTLLKISGISVTTGYHQSNNCPAQLGAGGACTIQVSFSPNRKGALNGVLSVSDDSSTSPQVLSLYGSGVGGGMNLTQSENAKPGDSSWQLTNRALNHEIEGYASLTSVNRGQSINFFVNTTAPSYSMDLYRMGWYNGAGARKMLPTISLPGVQQPSCSTDSSTLMVECDWASTYTLSVPYSATDPTDWASGIYLIKLTESATQTQSYIIFVVRDDARHSDVLFVSPTNTYQAYNDWGGYSLYTTPRAYKVSYNRPYLTGNGAGIFAVWGWENSMIRFLEREGYDVTYATSVDLDTDPNLALSHKAYLSVGHDEYWSVAMRNNITSARDQGINLGFFSSNNVYWQVRMEPSPATGAPDRTVTCYKSASLDPFDNDGNPADQALVTVHWRDAPVNLPEAPLVGVMYVSETFGQFDLVVADAASWVFANTGLQNGDHLAGLLGYEADAIFPSSPSPIDDLTHSPYPVNGVTSFSDMTVYTAASGATVAATGTMHWNWGLDDLASSPQHDEVIEPAAQQVTRNILHKFGAVSPSD